MKRHGFQPMAFVVLVVAVSSGGLWVNAMGKPPNKPVELPGCVTFREVVTDDVISDGIFGDGLGPYCKAGIFPGDTFDRFKLHGDNKRVYYLDFSGFEPPFVGIGGSFQPSLYDPYKPKLLSMLPTDMSLHHMFMKLRDPASKKNYLFVFGANPGSFYDAGSDPIMITAGADMDGDTFADSWTFEGGVGLLVLYEKGGKKQTLQGLFYLPFSITFVRDLSVLQDRRSLF